MYRRMQKSATQSTTRGSLSTRLSSYVDRAEQRRSSINRGSRANSDEQRIRRDGRLRSGCVFGNDDRAQSGLYSSDKLHCDCHAAVDAVERCLSMHEARVRRHLLQRNNQQRAAKASKSTAASRGRGSRRRAGGRGRA